MDYFLYFGIMNIKKNQNEKKRKYYIEINISLAK
jgi:hypothetical protein